MKKRSGFQIMARLIGLVRPLAGYMVLAVVMGLIGHLAVSFITIFGGYAVAGLIGIETPSRSRRCLCRSPYSRSCAAYCVMRSSRATTSSPLSCWR